MATTVRLVGALGETPAPVASLLDATIEPPACSESVVIDNGGLLLAEAAPTGLGYRWEYTVPGRHRIEREIHGERRAS